MSSPTPAPAALTAAPITVGIDVAKATLDVAVRPAERAGPTGD